MAILLYRTTSGPIVDIGGQTYSAGLDDWDDLLNLANLPGYLRSQARPENEVPKPATLEAPVCGQEIWGAGVTYSISRSARMEESHSTGGGNFYHRVYDAARPELFFKATAARVAAPGGTMRLRRDSRWLVPEPELALVVNCERKIIGYTIANDLTCRDIEGENPLYLPQAKIWDGCASIGPGLLIQDAPLPLSTTIRLEILRQGEPICSDSTVLAKLKRDPRDLVAYLTRECSFPLGCFLMTGTGIVPAEGLSLQPGDEVRITIAPIGTLSNTMS